jgi:hypothetical protein
LRRPTRAAAAASPAASGPSFLWLLLLFWLLRTAVLSAGLRPGRLAFAAGFLLELLQLLLHELSRRRLLAVANLVVPAVRTTAPTFGIRLLAG